MRWRLTVRVAAVTVASAVLTTSTIAVIGMQTTAHHKRAARSIAKLHHHHKRADHSVAERHSTNHHFIWLLAESHFDQVVSVPAVRALFARGVVYEPITPHQHASTLVPVIPTADFHSEQLLAEAVNGHTLAPGVRAVIYDNERFANTPLIEQQHIRRYTDLAASVAAKHGLESICDFIQPDRLPHGARTPVNEVPPCSIVGLNTVQQSERSPSRYRAVVAREVAIIRKVNPRAPIIAGLSSNPRGAPVSASELTADMKATVGLVNGFWLNVPAPGVGCPQCHAPDPALMATALSKFAKLVLPTSTTGGAGALSSTSSPLFRVSAPVPSVVPPNQPPVAYSGPIPAIQGGPIPGIPRTQSSAPVVARPIRWYVASSALRTLISLEGTSWALAHLVPHATTVITHTATLPTTQAPWQGSVVLDATSLAEVRADIAISPHDPVLLDLEAWPLTPLPEQRTAPQVELAAGALLKAHGSSLVSAPAIDLGHVLVPHKRDVVGYLASQLLPDAAHASTVVDIQAQGMEGNPVAYSSFVRRVALILRNANPNVQVIAGLSTNPDGHVVRVGELLQDVRLTSGVVSGYWLNIPRTSVACPSCGVPQPQIAIALLDALTN
jgi:hypothetical protein